MSWWLQEYYRCISCRLQKATKWDGAKSLENYSYAFSHMKKTGADGEESNITPNLKRLVLATIL